MTDSPTHCKFQTFHSMYDNQGAYAQDMKQATSTANRLPPMIFVSILTRAYALQPFDILAHRGQVLEPRLRDQQHVFNSYPSHALVLRKNGMINMWGVADGGQQMRREVDPGLNRLGLQV